MTKEGEIGNRERGDKMTEETNYRNRVRQEARKKEKPETAKEGMRVGRGGKGEIGSEKWGEVGGRRRRGGDRLHRKRRKTNT